MTGQGEFTASVLCRNTTALKERKKKECDWHFYLKTAGCETIFPSPFAIPSSDQERALLQSKWAVKSFLTVYSLE